MMLFLYELKLGCGMIAMRQRSIYQTDADVNIIIRVTVVFNKYKLIPYSSCEI